MSIDGGGSNGSSDPHGSAAFNQKVGTLRALAATAYQADINDERAAYPHVSRYSTGPISTGVCAGAYIMGPQRDAMAARKEECEKVLTQVTEIIQGFFASWADNPLQIENEAIGKWQELIDRVEQLKNETEQLDIETWKSLAGDEYRKIKEMQRLNLEKAQTLAINEQRAIDTAGTMQKSIAMLAMALIDITIESYCRMWGIDEVTLGTPQPLTGPHGRQCVKHNLSRKSDPTLASAVGYLGPWQCDSQTGEEVYVTGRHLENLTVELSVLLTRLSRLRDSQGYNWKGTAHHIGERLDSARKMIVEDVEKFRAEEGDLPETIDEADPWKLLERIPTIRMGNITMTAQ